MIEHRVFHSMGIPVHLTMVGNSAKDADYAAQKAETIFSEYDKRFTRFKENSELHKLNSANGEWYAVSLPMFQVLKKCIALAEETDGAFDPSVGGILASYGYGLPRNFVLPSPLPTYRDIEFNDRELSVRLAVGQVLEPASIVKGIAIDEAGKSVIEVGVTNFLINAGGDIITHGAFYGGASWNIAIQDPGNTDAVVTAVTLRDAGMATSGTYQTKGVHKGKVWHHLVDMRTGKPSGSGITSATVIAKTCEEADTEASLAILLSENEAIERLERRRLPYFLIHKDGRVSKNEAFTELEVPIQSLLNQK